MDHFTQEPRHDSSMRRASLVRFEVGGHGKRFPAEAASEVPFVFVDDFDVTSQIAAGAEDFRTEVAAEVAAVLVDSLHVLRQMRSPTEDGFAEGTPEVALLLVDRFFVSPGRKVADGWG